MLKFAIPALLILAIAGCTQPENKETTTEPKGTDTTGTAPKTDFKVALLTPGPITDQGWSALAYKGLTAIRDKMGAEVANAEAVESQIPDAMRSYAQKGYGFIIGHGYEYNKPAAQLAKDFPNTVFISSSGGETAKNVGAFRFYLEQGFYLAGYMSGMMTKSGTVAMIGGPDVPSIRSTFKAFKKGAEDAKPGIKVIETFTGDGADAVKAKQATEKAIAAGADLVIHQANAAATGVFQACKEKNVYAFGANADQNSDPSNAVIASAVIVADNAFLDLAQKIKDGKYTGEISLKGMDSGSIDFVTNAHMKDTIPSAVLEKIASLKADIKSGKLVVPKDDF